MSIRSLGQDKDRKPVVSWLQEILCNVIPLAPFKRTPIEMNDQYISNLPVARYL